MKGRPHDLSPAAEGEEEECRDLATAHSQATRATPERKSATFCATSGAAHSD